MNEISFSAVPESCRPRSFLWEVVLDLSRSCAPAQAIFIAMGLDPGLRARHRRVWLGYLRLFIPVLAATGIGSLMQSCAILAAGRTSLPYPVFVFSAALIQPSLLYRLGRPHFVARPG